MSAIITDEPSLNDSVPRWGRSVVKGKAPTYGLSGILPLSTHVGFKVTKQYLLGWPGLTLFVTHAWGFAAVNALSSVLLPAFGKPTSPTSASTLTSSTS